MRLTAAAKTKWRAARLGQNAGLCALCGLECRRPVVDHNHRTGAVRDVICGGCNSLLGRLENNAPRFNVDLERFCAGVGAYLKANSTSQHDLTHDSYRTLEQKRDLVRKRAARNKLRRKVALQEQRESVQEVVKGLRKRRSKAADSCE